MTQTERREWLIKYLLNEADSSDEYRKIEIPPHNDESAQKDLPRSMRALTTASTLSPEFSFDESAMR